MSLKKRINRENAKFSAENQMDDFTADKDEVSTSTSARELRRRDRTEKQEMTEEEMMALALRLSEQEANITAQKLQEEEEAVKKALQDSMFAESQSLMEVAPAGAVTRRKLVYQNGESQTDTVCSNTASGEDISRAAASVFRSRKRKRVDHSPLMEMPDLSQTQLSPSSSESAALASEQSPDSTQIEDCDLPPSPVFPSSLAQVQVRVPRLDQKLLESCSQDSDVSHCHQRLPSPTFPSSKPETTDAQMFSLSDDTQPELSQEPNTSPAFGQADQECALKSDATKVTVLTFSSPESSGSFGLETDVCLSKSPVFPKSQEGSDRGEGSQRISPVFGTNGRIVETREDRIEEQEGAKDEEEEQNLSQTIDMTLHWSEEDDDATPVVSPSPVFPEERRDLQTVNQNNQSAPCQTQSRASAPQSGPSVSEPPDERGDSLPQSTVHYYWGVPFCPQGLDPDQYTKVIVAQLEVYEKSLKQAQRSLLNKAQWGEPVLPQPEKCPSPESKSPQSFLRSRRSRRLRGKLKELESEEEAEDLIDDAQGSQSLWEDKEGHEEEEKKDEEEGDEEGDKEINQDTAEEEEEGQQKEPVQEPVSEEQREEEEETQVESDCDFCPETQLSDDPTQELTLNSQALDGSPEIEMIQVDSPNVPEPQTHQTPEEPEEPKDPQESNLSKREDMDFVHSELQPKQSSQPSQSPDPNQNQDQSQNPKMVLEELFGPDGAPGPDLEPCLDLISEVQCPLCLQIFPSERIEMHAAYCDGAPDKVSPKPRRKRLRKGASEEASHTDSGPTVPQAQEKCYICLKAVPLKDYSLHTDRCLQRPSLRNAATGGLLSALDQSEYRNSEAGPSGSTAQPHEVIDLVGDEEEEENSVSLIQISNSPIRSFTSISEAQDCLIDFSMQHQAKRPGSRAGTRLGTKHRSKRR